MNEQLPAVDTPPQSGAFVEHDELVLTDEEIAEGNRLGGSIDILDDADNGNVRPPR